MLFSQSINSVFAHYASFVGRASRSEYWYFVLFQLIVYAIFLSLGVFFAGSDGQPALWVVAVMNVYAALTLLPAITVTVRRLHDTGRGGQWIFIGFVPVIGQIWLLVLTLLPSELDDNRFGPTAD